MYPAMIIALFLVLPIGSIVVEALVRRRRGAPVELLAIAGRWFVFWPVGVRLFTAGLMQIVNPGYTAQDVFGLSDPAVLPLVSELGFANVAMGAAALVSVAVAAWRTPAALIGLLYFGLAGMRHLVSGGEFTDVRLIAMISDLFIAAVLAVHLALLLARRRQARPVRG
ncbi:MAG: hypothetical protein BGO95_10375 [Micrococcales bacterium 73-13]|nr:MAG: hypothetical protein BGO95_10375 [Micrococcales bacterium 73-13]